MSLSLCDLIDKIEWTVIPGRKNSTGNGLSLSDKEVGISVLKDKKGNQFNTLHVRFSTELLHKLNWILGDRIIAMHNPNDLFELLLVRSSNGDGRKLARENKTSFRLQIKMPDSYPDLKEFSNRRCRVDVFEKYLKFNLREKSRD